MANIRGYNGKILRVDLTRKAVSVEEPKEDFYRRYLGGSGFIGYFLLKELSGGEEPLGPDNKLVFAVGPATGAPISGGGRNSVGARSPLTGGYGEAEVGGYWGTELKQAGYDAIIIEGKADSPVYIWINDDKVEIRDAGYLWGKTTTESQKLIWDELGDSLVRVAQIGPAGEKLVRYACIVNELSHAAGRTGMGAVMGAKNLKAIAVRGHRKITMADPAAVTSLAKQLRDYVKTSRFYQIMSEFGTPGRLVAFSMAGGLPTRNFQSSNFEGAAKIAGETMKDTILVGHRSCYGCAIRCKPEVAVGEPYHVDPINGGPEYETIAALGSSCGIDNLEAIAKANELCTMNGLDTISTGNTIAFAMECFERGILTPEDTGGLELNFGNAGAMVQMVEMIARRQGLGGILAEGVARSARTFGKGAEDFANHIKGQELPMHEPRYKQGMGVGYAIAPTGAEHCNNIHDDSYTRRIVGELASLGVFEPLPAQELSPAKVRMTLYASLWRHLLNCLVYCIFVPLSPSKTAELVEAITGWDTSVFELMKVAERCTNMGRVFNLREGKTREDDYLPRRFFTPLPNEPLRGVSVDRTKLDEAIAAYYGMAGWDENGVPTLGKLQELDIAWVAKCLPERVAARAG
ncbi:MAG: aldehyde ferredoxin oxidoreductase family protein [Chloroflexi bacterium]|nr:aldehyde ferredoxin oxidoreductase family protein [Chloroflexota bacterium]